MIKCKFGDVKSAKDSLSRVKVDCWDGKKMFDLERKCLLERETKIREKDFDGLDR